MEHRLNFSYVRRFGAVVFCTALLGCSAQIHHRTGLAAMASEDYAQGVSELKQAAALQPRDVEYQQDWLANREQAINRLIARADAKKSKGDLSSALESYQTILKFDALNERAQAGLKDIASITGAAEDVERAKSALKKGENGEAIRFVERALDRHPANSEAYRLKNELERALSQEMPGTVTLGAVYQKPINLEFRDASLRIIFDALARTTGVNFIFDRDVKPELRATVFLKQTRFEDAIDVLLATNQLEKKVLNPTSVLIYPNTPAKLKEYQELLVRVFYLANIDAKTAANMLKSVLKLKDVYVDEKYHMVVLRENAETIALAEKLIALQDLEEPEVMLEVEVLEVNRNRLLNLGLQVTNQFTVSPLTNGLANGGTGSVGGSTASTFKLSDLLHLNQDKLGITLPSATLSLQKTDGDANLLANPRLRVRDRDKAKILIGDRVPIVTTTTTPNGFLSENVQYQEVGLKLEVEPEIHIRDEIGLKLSLEVSSLVGSIKTSNGSQAYQIGTRTFSSSLRLRDGETQVLAGLISDADRSDASRIPLLGDVPLLGRLFSSQKDDRQKTEIVMSITPHLIRNIQRKSPAAEVFWSGTESTLRTRPVHLNPFAPTAVSSAKAIPSKETVSGLSAGVPDSSGLHFSWKSPKVAKPGQSITLELMLDTKHQLRALPLQLAFDHGSYEVIDVEAGDYFSRNGVAQFSKTIDKAGGRISINLGNNEGTGATGLGTLLKLQLRPITGASDTKVSVISLTPIGTVQALQVPAVPISVQIELE